MIIVQIFISTAVKFNWVSTCSRILPWLFLAKSIGMIVLWGKNMDLSINYKEIKGISGKWFPATAYKPVHTPGFFLKSSVNSTGKQQCRIWNNINLTAFTNSFNKKDLYCSLVQSTAIHLIYPFNFYHLRAIFHFHQLSGTLHLIHNELPLSWKLKMIQINTKRIHKIIIHSPSLVRAAWGSMYCAVVSHMTCLVKLCCLFARCVLFPPKALAALKSIIRSSSSSSRLSLEPSGKRIRSVSCFSRSSWMNVAFTGCCLVFSVVLLSFIRLREILRNQSAWL